MDRNGNGNGGNGTVFDAGRHPIDPRGGAAFIEPNRTRQTGATTLASCAVAGCLAFGSTLALSTLAQLRLLGVSTGTSPRLVPSALGFLSVSAASLVGHHVALFAKRGICDCYADRGGFPVRPSMALGVSSMMMPHWDEVQCAVRRWSEGAADLWNGGETWSLPAIGDVRVSANQIHICCVGLVAFRLLGGRFWSVSPSSFTALGSFARVSLPADGGTRYAPPSVRNRIDAIGRRYGCHTCGSGRRLFARIGPSRFIADHVPPNAVVRQLNARDARRFLGLRPATVRQRFFPQCAACSGAQGGILSSAGRRASASPGGAVRVLRRAGGGRSAHFHGWTFRSHHLAGAAVGVAAALECEGRDGGGRGSGVGGGRRGGEGDGGLLERAETLAERVLDHVAGW